ncbi:hypothetical protein A0H81_11068 [Grifola frondosa]|uniref:MATH domain-containing protein n=1 Tax=Grifola frondosa TaxID=5627 RepID=A0A1C7LWC8_GRIFR|nr:hypothetical protein A0H81_11068 [Grifola frondosa]
MFNSTVTYRKLRLSCRFEWNLRDLKSIFDSSKGDAKSKVTKSVKFGDGRWQVLFYANSGSASSEGHFFVSLYLSCEPTAEEKENVVNGKWSRAGLFNFSFEIRNLQKTVLFASKEAHDHSFFYPGAQNWGLLDDAIYSDVEFVIPRRCGSPKRIYAARRLLRRVEYFDTMFGSGFAEASSDQPTIDVSSGSVGVESPDGVDAVDAGREFDDSDIEDDDDDPMVLDDESVRDKPRDVTEGSRACVGGAPTESWLSTSGNDGTTEPFSERQLHETERNVRPKLSHPSTPRSTERTLERSPERRPVASASILPQEEVPGPKKARVVVRDVAYTTYRAVLYYIYTDTIVFAPLSSSFLTSSALPTPVKVIPVVSTPPVIASESQAQNGMRSSQQQPETVALTSTGPFTRREWIEGWERNNPGRLRPPSAKSVYRLADKLDLQELKERAFLHITKSLTVNNVAYEVFSTFSSAFEDVRKVQVRFFLENWAAIRTSDAMRNVWQQIRLGRHPGFEDVWPAIAQNLEFKPQNVESAGGEKKDVLAGEV